jgi:uncharacterized protein with HEPN domain
VKDDQLYLIHISECIQHIEKYIGAGGRDAFMASGPIQDAVIRNLQTLAESATRCRMDYKQSILRWIGSKFGGFAMCWYMII